MILSGLLAFIALIIAIAAIAQGNILRSRIENLEKERGRVQPVVPPPPPTAAVPPPLPKWLQNPPPAAAPPPVPPTIASPPPSPRAPVINWETFVGVKLFAWIGGFAFFLGVVFFVKYAFENNFVTPFMRVLISGVVGLALIGLGILPRLRRYRIPAQSLIATGLLICYADIYGAHSFYNLISLTAACFLMWCVTGIALVLGASVDSHWILWLGVIGGFLTPFLFRTGYQTAPALFGYIGVLCCGITAVAAVKRWSYFILVAAVCTVVVELTWSADLFQTTEDETSRLVFFAFQALFLAVAYVLVRTSRASVWSITAAAVAGVAPILAFIVRPLGTLLQAWDFGFLTLVLAAAGIIALAAMHRNTAGDSVRLAGMAVVIALAVTWLGELKWWDSVFHESSGVLNDAPLSVDERMGRVGLWFVVIFLVFAATPFVCDDTKTWFWVIASVAGPLQFGFVLHSLTDFLHLNGTPVLGPNLKWVVPLGFALPPAIGIFYLVRRRGVPLVSGDSRLAAQGAALLTFITLIFPVQFQREWITLGWALEGLGLILLFERLPNRRLRLGALIVFCAAFVRLALNPAVLEYHPRSHTPILNWYLYAYGVSALCMLLGAYWFNPPRERSYERIGPGLLYSLGGIVLFLLLNIEIADYFSIGPTLTFSFAGNFARDMTYTISWSIFAFLLLVVGMLKQIRPLRFAAVALLCAALAKLFLHDLASLSQLYRIAAFISVAVIAIVASFVYQRFLSVTAKE